MLVRNYHYSLRYNPEERSSQVDVLFGKWSLCKVCIGAESQASSLAQKTPLLVQDQNMKLKKFTEQYFSWEYWKQGINCNIQSWLKRETID